MTANAPSSPAGVTPECVQCSLEDSDVFRRAAASSRASSLFAPLAPATVRSRRPSIECLVDPPEDHLLIAQYNKTTTRKRTYSYAASGRGRGLNLGCVRALIGNDASPPESDSVTAARPSFAPPAPLPPTPLFSSPRFNAQLFSPERPPSSRLSVRGGGAFEPRKLEFDGAAGAAAATAVGVSSGSPEEPVASEDDGELACQEEDDSEAELEGEVAADVVLWWTPRGWWRQICLLLGLAAQLISALGMSFKWMRMLARLVLFSAALAPAWYLIGRTYLTAKYIRRSVRYGLNARNHVDLYLPHRIVSDAPPSDLCSHHATVARKRSVDRLSLVERLHLAALLEKSAGSEIDRNAMHELNDAAVAEAAEVLAQGPQQGNKVEQFAAELVAEPGQKTDDTNDTTTTTTNDVTKTPSRARAMSSTSDRVHPAISISPPSGGGVAGGQLSPVVIFLTGGAWSIGHKAWGALLGLGLSAHGVLVASVDYRNFPQGDVADMCTDVHTAITWVFRHAHEYGGDPSRIFLAGQSAGAHLGSLAVLQNAAALLRGEKTTWASNLLAGFIGISGSYDIAGAKLHFHERGLPLWVLQRMMRAQTDEEFAKVSPTLLVDTDVFRRHARAFERLMPPFLLLHGKADKTVSWRATHEFAKALQQAKVKVKVRYYKNYSHTDPIIEGPLTGHDHLCHDLLVFLHDHNQRSVVAPFTHSAPGSVIGTPARGVTATRTLQPAYSSPTSANKQLTPTPPPSVNGGARQDEARTSRLTRTPSSSVGTALPHYGAPFPPSMPPSLASCPPPPSSRLSSLSELFATLCAPLSWCGLPSFMLPSSARVRWNRRPSHLPYPFQSVDDVEDLEDDDASDEAPDGKPTNGNGIAATSYSTDLAIDALHPLPLRVWRAVSRRCGWLVPAVVQDASVRLARPIIDFLRPSPPPVISSPSTPVSPASSSSCRDRQVDESRNSDDENEEGGGDEQSSDVRLRSRSPALEALLPPLAPTNASSARARHVVNHQHAGSNDTVCAPRSRYVYPLQPAAQLPHTPPHPLIPRVLIRTARWINPF